MPFWRIAFWDLWFRRNIWRKSPSLWEWILLLPACPAARGGRTRKFCAGFLVANESCPEWMETGEMAASGQALCLFDVDGTLTAPRQVGSARRAGGSGCRPSGCSERWHGVEKPLKAKNLYGVGKRGSGKRMPWI